MVERQFSKLVTRVRFPSPALFALQKERGSPQAARSIKMFTVYILQSLKDNRTYVGYTNDFERRFKQHNSGEAKSTRNRKPFKLLLKETFKTGFEAKKRELWWKSGVGRRKLKDLFETRFL